MSLFEQVKLAYARLPAPGYKRVLMTDAACYAFDGGRPRALTYGLRHGFQCYAMDSADYAAAGERPPERILDKAEIEQAFVELPRAAAIYPACVDLEILPGELEYGNEDHLRSLSRWILLCREISARCAKLASQLRPHAIVYFQGYLPEAAILRQIALRRRIPFLAIERTAFEQRIVWDTLSGIAVNRNCAKNYYWRMEDSIPQGEADRCASEYLGSIDTHKQSEHATPARACALPKRPGKLGILFIGQVLTDTSILFGQRADLDPLATIDCLARFAIDNGHRLFIKLHPKEHGGRSPLGRDYGDLTYRRLLQFDWARRPEGEDNPIAIDRTNGWNTFKLIEGADLVATVNSQAGLEAALMGKPVVVCGESFYRDLGFTLEPGSLSDLRELLERFDASAFDTKATRRLAARFFYSFVRGYCVPRTVHDLFRLIRMTCDAGFPAPSA